MMAISRTLSFAFSIIIVCAILYNAISNHLFEGNKSLFFSDPFNFENRLKFLSDEFVVPEIAPERLKILLNMAEAGTKLEPLNARIFSIAGALKQKTDKDGAQAYYDKALSLERTERIALTQKYVYLIEKSNYKEAIPILEVLSARWPVSFRKLRPTLPLLIQSPETFDEMLNRFQSRSNILTIIVQSIMEHTKQVGLAYQFVLAAHDKYGVDVHEMSRPITAELLKQNKISDAYLLFHSSLFDEEKEISGYVFNSKFSAEPTSFYFDWSIKGQAGVNIQRIPSRVLNPENTAQSRAGGLEIKFLNAPVSFSNVSQILYLPKKKFQLSVHYTIDDFKGPNPMSIKLECVKPRATLAEVELSKLETKEETITTEFTVPTSGCDLQKVLITNNNIVESWQNRFSGKVILHDISIKVAGS